MLTSNFENTHLVNLLLTFQFNFALFKMKVKSSGGCADLHWIHILTRTKEQGRSQNLKEVPQNFMEVFNVDGSFQSFQRYS